MVISFESIRVQLQGPVFLRGDVPGSNVLGLAEFIPTRTLRPVGAQTAVITWKSGVLRLSLREA